MKHHIRYIHIILLSTLTANGLLVSNGSTPVKKVRITIMVHGIMSIKPHLSFSNFIRFLTDSVENTVYSETVKRMRNNPFFYKNQAMQEIGLHKIDTLRIEKGYASGLIARLLNEVEHLANSDDPYENHYYNFGWHGLLSARIRYFEALPLYNAILDVVKEFRAQGIEPEVRLIGYSHGGNLCLNLGAIRQNADVDHSLTIHELVLLGVPIQCETDFLINDPIFRRIYQIYSRGDRIQKLDFFSTKRFFSRRVFKARKYFTLPDKLTQIQIRMTRSVRSKKQKKASCYNINKIPILSGKSRQLRDISPGHIELWFLGWTPSNYRPHLGIAPLPLVIFLPFILDQINTTLNRTQCIHSKKPIIMDIRPEFDHIIIKNQKSWKNVTVTEFFNKEMMQQLIDISTPYIPDGYTLEDYAYHIEMALEQAKRSHINNYQHYKGHHRRCSKKCDLHKKKPILKSALAT